MIFKPVPGFPNYIINRSGQLYSIKRKVIIKEKPGGTKLYPRYELWHNGQRFHKWIHRLVCDVWVSSVEGKEVHHRDGNVFNYHASNLIPLSHKEHLIATKKQREEQARLRAEKLKQDCPF